MKKIGAIVLITFLVCGLIIAAPVGDDYRGSCDTTYCNGTTNSSQVNGMLKFLRNKADDIVDEIGKICEEINVSHYISMHYLTCVGILGLSLWKISNP